MSYDDFDLDRARELRERAKDVFVRQVRRDFIKTALVSVPAMALVAYGAIEWATATTVEDARFHGTLYLLGALLFLGLWGLHAVTMQGLLLAKEIRLVRLVLQTATERAPSFPTGGAESLNWWGALRSRPWLVLLAAAMVIVAVPMAVSFTHSAHRLQYPYTFEDFGADEVVSVHITADERLRAVARLVVTKHPREALSLPIRVAQPGATLESVTLNGRELPVTLDEDDGSLYAALTGVPASMLKDAVVEVVWGAPLHEAMEGDAVQFHLGGTLPVRRYAINVIVDDGAPYVAGPFDETWQKSGTVFWTGSSDYKSRQMGSAWVVLRPTL